MKSKGAHEITFSLVIGDSLSWIIYPVKVSMGSVTAYKRSSKQTMRHTNMYIESRSAVKLYITIITHFSTTSKNIISHFGKYEAVQTFS